MPFAPGTREFAWAVGAGGAALAAASYYVARGEWRLRHRGLLGNKLLAASLITSALHVSYRDLAPVVTLGLQVWLYLTPVSYPLSIVPAELRPWYLLNPMAGLIESYRDVVIHGRAPQMDALGASIIISLLLFAIAYPFFKRAERAFADVI